MQPTSLARSGWGTDMVAGAVNHHHQSSICHPLPTSHLQGLVSTRPRSLGVRCQAENGAAKASSSTRGGTTQKVDPSGRMVTGAQPQASPEGLASRSSLQPGSSPAGFPSFPSGGPSPGVRGSSPGPEAGKAATPARPTFDDLMSFDGIPELLNGRLAMLGFAAGSAVEVLSGVSFLDQVFDPNQFGLFYFGLATVVVTGASVIPLLKGSSAAKAQFFVFTEDAEKANGRLAMLGLLGIFLIEYIASFVI